MGSRKGQPGNNKFGNPHWDEVRDKRGSKPGVKRGPYRTNKLFRNKDYMMGWNPKNLKLVEGEKSYPGAKNFLRTIVQTESLPMRERRDAAAVLMPYEEVKREGSFLGIKWEQPAPKSPEEALDQQCMIIDMHRQQRVTDVEAVALSANIVALFPMIDRIEIINGIAELREAVAANPPVVEFNAVGGLPRLPGAEDIIMPDDARKARKMGTSVGPEDGNSDVAEPAARVEEIDPAAWYNDQDNRRPPDESGGGGDDGEGTSS
jgi:hypothetical protein